MENPIMKSELERTNRPIKCNSNEKPNFNHNHIKSFLLPIQYTSMAVSSCSPGVQIATILRSVPFIPSKRAIRRKSEIMRLTE